MADGEQYNTCFTKLTHSPRTTSAGMASERGAGGSGVGTDFVLGKDFASSSSAAAASAARRSYAMILCARAATRSSVAVSSASAADRLALALYASTFLSAAETAVCGVALAAAPGAFHDSPPPTPTACACHSRMSDTASLLPTGPPMPPWVAAAAMTIDAARGERNSVARSSHADVAATVRPAPAVPGAVAAGPPAPAAARSRISAHDSGAAATHCHAAAAAPPVPGSGAAARTAARPLADRANARHTAALRGASNTEGSPPARGGGTLTSAPAAVASIAAICGTALVSHAILGAAKQ